METGKIKEILNNNTAIVSMDCYKECEICPAKTTCNLFTTGEKTIKVRYNGELKFGDSIELIFRPKKRIISAIIIFLIPVLALIGFYYLGFYLFKREIIAIFFSIGGLFFSFVVIYFVIKLNKGFRNFMPVVVKIKK